MNRKGFLIVSIVSVGVLASVLTPNSVVGFPKVLYADVGVYVHFSYNYVEDSFSGVRVDVKPVKWQEKTLVGLKPYVSVPEGFSRLMNSISVGVLLDGKNVSERIVVSESTKVFEKYFKILDVREGAYDLRVVFVPTLRPLGQSKDISVKTFPIILEPK